MQVARAVLKAKGLSPPQRLHRQAATERVESACGDGAVLRSVAPKNIFSLRRDPCAAEKKKQVVSFRRASAKADLAIWKTGRTLYTGTKLLSKPANGNEKGIEYLLNLNLCTTATSLVSSSTCFG